MGGRGRPPRPTHLKLLEGTYRKDRAPRNEPKPAASTPSCPTWLHREAKREWRRIVPHLEQLKLLTQVDRAALAAYCEAYAVWWQATKELRKYGLVQELESGYVAQRPEVGIRNTAWKTMRTYLALFGLSPSDRTRLSTPDAGGEVDPFDAFLKRGADTQHLQGGGRRPS